MSFFFDRLARSSGSLPIRPAVQPGADAIALEQTVEREVVAPPSAMHTSPDSPPASVAASPAAAPPVRETRVEQREIIREQLVERIIEREVPAPAPATPRATVQVMPQSAADASPVVDLAPSSDVTARPVMPTAPQVMEHVFKWLARESDPRVPRVTEPSIAQPSEPPAPATVALLPEATPLAMPAVRRSAPVDVEAVSAPRSAAQSTPSLVVSPPSAQEETVEYRIGAIHVVVEGASHPAHAPAQRPMRRPIREPEPPAPDDVRRYALLPN